MKNKGIAGAKDWRVMEIMGRVGGNVSRIEGRNQEVQEESELGEFKLIIETEAD